MSEAIAKFGLEKYVVLRTYSAGVHVGVLVARSGAEAILRDARRIWQWKGAHTLHEISLEGIDRASKVSAVQKEVLVRGVIEILPCTPAAEANLRGGGWAT